jgi:hypothetical protein
MTAPARVPLGASTTNGKWWVDVDTADDGDAPTWTGVFGITDLTPGGVDVNLEDDTDFDSGGFGSQTKTGESWSLEMTVARKTVQGAGTTYDPGQEFLRLRSYNIGAANSVHVRWYEMSDGGPRVEAFDGYAAVSWAPEGGSVTDLSTVTVTLNGQGRRNAITHPGAGGGGGA